MATPTDVKDLPLKEVNQSQSGVDCKTPLDSQHNNNNIKTCSSTKCKAAASPGLGIPDRLKLPKPFKFPERYTSPTDHIISPISKGLRARSRRGGAVLPPSISEIHSQIQEL